MNSQTTPEVSICITTHNHQNYIQDCVMSVINQSEDLSIEIIIGDDGSTDKTGIILKSLSESHSNVITLITHNPRIGYGSLNLQQIIKMARGKYIAHLDGDDFWLPGKLREQVNFLEKNQDHIAVYSNALCVNSLGHPVGVFNNTQHKTKFDIKELMVNGNFLNHSSLMYRSCFAKSIKEWTKPFIDYKIHLHLAQLGYLGYINKILTGYRVGSIGSALTNRGDFVRSLYWSSINEVPTDIISESTQLKASADFLCKIFFRTVKIRSWRLISEWWPIIEQRHHHQKLLLITLTALKTVNYGLKLTRTTLTARISGTYLRVFYWH